MSNDPSSRPPLTLRSILAAMMALVTVLTVLVAGALVILTTSLRDTTIDAGTSVENVRLAENATIDLLLHERATDPVVKRDIEGNLLSKLDEARRFVTTDEEARALANAEQLVDAYIAAHRD